MAADSNTNESHSPGIFPIAMTVLAGALRLVPHLTGATWWSVAPVTAVSLYGGARLRFWQALTLPMMVMFCTDVLIRLLRGPEWAPFSPWVYGSFAVSVLLGRLLANTNSPWRIGLCSLLASAQFFLITNF